MLQTLKFSLFLFFLGEESVNQGEDADKNIIYPAYECQSTPIMGRLTYIYFLGEIEIGIWNLTVRLPNKQWLLQSENSKEHSRIHGLQIRSSHSNR